MDDRTLVICAATLCVLGVSLTQILGTGPLGRTGHPTAVATASAPPAVKTSLDALGTMREPITLGSAVHAH